MDDIEKKLNEVFVTKAPVQLPEKAKKWIVEYSPYIGLVLGVLGVLAAMSLWRSAHYVNDFVKEVDRLYGDYGITGRSNRVSPDLGVSFWIAWMSLLSQAVISVIAFPGLKARSKVRGWNLLFYSAVISLVSGIFYGLYDSSVSSVIGRIIGSAIGFYFIFQVRSYYLGKKSTEGVSSPKPAAKK